MRKLVGDLAPSPLINSSIAFLPAVIGFGFYTVSGVTEINLPACLVIIFIAMANVTFCRVWHRIDTYLFRLAILYGYVPFQWIYLFAITGFYFNPFNGQVFSLLIFALCSGMTVMAILYFKTRMDVSSGAFAIKGISVAALWGSAAFSDGTLHTFVNNDQVQVEEIKTQSDSTNLLLSDSQFVGEKMIQKKSSLSRKARFDKACGFSSPRSPIDLDPKTQGGRSRIELSELKTNVLVSRGVDTLFLGDISNDNVKIDRTSRFMHSMEFRTPSEHAVNGYRFPMEIQVYLSEGSLNQMKEPSSAISIFVVEGNANSEFEKMTPILKNLESESFREALNLKLFFPNDLSHWVYSGTSTSLNCQNGQSLNWFVMKQPVSFSRDQIDLFRRIYSNNALSVIGPLTPSKIISKSNEIAH